MNVFAVTFQTITILLLIGALGFVLISRKILPDNVLQSLSRLALEIALPCLVLKNILTNFRPARDPGWWRLPLWFLAFVGFSLAMAGLGTLLARRGGRREFAMALLYNNMVFVPLIIIAERFGPDSPRLANLFLFTLLFSPFYFGTYAFFFMRRSALKIPWNRVFNPVFVVSIAAISMCLLGWQDIVPAFVVSAAELIGNMSVPLLLIILGGTIYLDMRACQRPPLLEVAKFVVLKNLIFPVVAMLLLLWIRPAREVAYLLVLQSAVPPITSLPIVTERSGGNRGLVNYLLVASFVAALVTIPAALTIFERLF
jgi:predicted permease